MKIIQKLLKFEFKDYLYTLEIKIFERISKLKIFKLKNLYK
jgi:hypothetical protein